MSHKHQPVIPPIYQTVSFSCADGDAFADAAAADRPERFYTRYGNPTLNALQTEVADLEGAESSLAMASGMAALSAALFGLVGAGDHVVAQRALYGGTTGLLTRLAARLAIDVDFVAQGDPHAFTRSFKPNTRLLILETPSNPLLCLTDIAAVSAIARERGIVTLVDSTLGSPVNQQLLPLGADLVMHSATKYLSGHGDVLAGVLAGSDSLIARIWSAAFVLGATLDPHAAFLASRGLKTLGLRMAAHNRGAMEIASWLSARNEVSAVHYPGLPSHPQHELARRQMPGGFGGVLSFEIAAGRAGAEAFVSALRQVRRAASFGSPTTFIVHPAAMWSGMIDDRALAEAGVPAGLLRLSVGLEPPDTILADLQRGLRAAGEREFRDA